MNAFSGGLLQELNHFAHSRYHPDVLVVVMGDSAGRSTGAAISDAIQTDTVRFYEAMPIVTRQIGALS